MRGSLNPSIDSCWTFCQSTDQYVKSSQSSAPHWDITHLLSDLFQLRSLLILVYTVDSVCFFKNLKFLPINKFNKHLQDPVTWYRINYAGTQVTQWNFQNKGRSGWTGTSYLVLEDPLYNLCPRVINSVPCYCFVFFSNDWKKNITLLCYHMP